MKNRLLPIFAAISLTAGTASANNAYVTDGYGNIVKDNYGSCVRSIHWTPEKANKGCEVVVKNDAASEDTQTKVQSTPAPTLLPAEKGNISGKGQNAYVIDSDGNIVRDNYGYCVRTINWTKDTAINKCEGWEEPKPVVVAKPMPKPVVVKKPEPKPEVKIVEAVPVAFRGFFDTNKAELKQEAFSPLNNYADYLNRNTDKQVKVVGHTDSTGSERYNQKLSEKRANAVKSYLEGKGIQADRIATQGAGELQPLASNKTKEGRAQNRRVEIEILK